jgi:hypothetical protein
MIESPPRPCSGSIEEACFVDAGGRLTTMLLEALSADDAESALGSFESLLADAGIIVSLRAHDGSFVYASPALRAQLPGGQLSGSFVAERARFYDAGGRELSLLHHPAQEVRRTGAATGQLVMGVQSPSSGHRWILVSYLPVERGPEGWSVAAVGIDLSSVWGQIEALQASGEAA